MRTSSVRAIKMPNTPKITPPIKLMRRAVCTTRSSRSSFFAPIHRAAAVHAPTDRPKNRFVIRLISDPVDPTAPADTSLANCPSVMMSDALYKSCKIPVAMIGREKRKILPRRGRDVMSSSLFFFFTFSLIDLFLPFFAAYAANVKVLYYRTAAKSKKKRRTKLIFQ